MKKADANFLPVVQRELREGARRPFNYWLRVAGATAGALLLYVVHQSASGNQAAQGLQLFTSLHLLLLALILVMVPAMSADCIAREKREDTLGLLFLTPLTAMGIVAGKGLVQAFRAFTLWLAVLPVLIIPCLSGGVTGGDVGSALTLEFCLTLLCLALVYYSVKGDRRWTTTGEAAGGALRGEIPAGWRAQKILSPIIGITYAFVLSLVAFDLIMSLDPDWYSTLFGGYYFVGSFYSGIVALYLLSLVLGKRPELKEWLHPRQFHDMGKLVMAFTLFTGYLFYAQFFVIWYANIPEETHYLIRRFRLAPWEQLGWLVLAMILFFPLFVLLSRRVKTRRPAMIALCLIVLAGMWLERFILVVPSVWKGAGIPLGALEALITAGFLGLVLISVGFFLSRVPMLPVSDPLFHKFIAEREERLRP